MASIDAIIRVVVRVIHLGLDYLKIKRRKSSYEDRQEERDHIEDEPTDWFGEHFDGDRVRFDAESKPSDAPKADKAED